VLLDSSSPRLVVPGPVTQNRGRISSSSETGIYSDAIGYLN
jgi:hypothetical protein